MYERAGWSAEKRNMIDGKDGETERYRKREERGVRDMITQFPADNLNISLQYEAIFKMKSLT